MMKRLFSIAMALTFSLTIALAQGTVKKVYDEHIDPLAQIDQAVQRAAAEKKYVVCQVGGNWCPWCLRFAHFAETDSAVRKTINDHFILIHVNYNPRRSASGDAANQAVQLTQRLGHPARFGFPVFVVLNGKGEVIHTQDSSFLEEGDGYSEKKVLRFFNNWTPAAVEAGK